MNELRFPDQSFEAGRTNHNVIPLAVPGVPYRTTDNECISCCVKTLFRRRIFIANQCPDDDLTTLMMVAIRRYEPDEKRRVPEVQPHGRSVTEITC